MKKFLLSMLAITLITTAITGCNSNTNNSPQNNSTTESTALSDAYTSVETTEKPTEKATKKPTDPPTDPPYDITPIINNIYNGNYYSASTEISSMSYSDYDEQITSAFKAEVSNSTCLTELFGDGTDSSNYEIPESIKTKWDDLQALYNAITSKTSESLSDYGNYISDIVEYCSLEKSDFEECTETLEYRCLADNMLNTNVYSSREELIVALNASESYSNSLYATYSSTNDQLLRDFFAAVDLWGVTLTNYYNAVYVNNTPVDVEAANADVVTALTQYRTVLDTHRTNLTNEMNLFNRIFDTQKILS